MHGLFWEFGLECRGVPRVRRLGWVAADKLPNGLYEDTWRASTALDLASRRTARNVYL